MTFPGLQKKCPSSGSDTDLTQLLQMCCTWVRQVMHATHLQQLRSSMAANQDG